MMAMVEMMTIEIVKRTMMIHLGSSSSRIGPIALMVIGLSEWASNQASLSGLMRSGFAVIGIS